MKVVSYPIALFTVIAAVWAAPSLDSRFGVKPALYELYSKPTISCKDKGSIPISKVNDDYCDCPENGEDEPGTSACSNGTFFCKNIGSRAAEIGSWKVNDGICDCCDGSDEYLGFVKCRDICVEEGKIIKERLESLALTLKQGLEEKQKLIRAGDSLKSTQQKRLEELEAQIQAKKPEVDNYRQKAAEADDAERAEKAIQDTRKEDNQPAKDIESDAEQARKKGTDPELADESPSHSSFPYPEQYAYTGESANEAPNSESSFPYPEQYAPHKSAEANSKAEEGTEKEPSSAQQETTSQETVKQEPIEPESSTVKAAREARQALRDAENQLSELEKEAGDVSKMLRTDYGPSSAYRTLHSECFTTTHDKYTYKLCPFREISQIESHSTSLGTFQQWGDDRTEWLFDHGQKCWNGPERSVKVKLLCGLQNQILSVQEPSTCVYEMQFETPAACSQEEADSLDAKLGELTQPEHVHDEL